MPCGAMPFPSIAQGNTPFNGFNTYHGQPGILHKLAVSRRESGLEAATNWLIIGGSGDLLELLTGWLCAHVYAEIIMSKEKELMFCISGETFKVN